MDIKIDKENIIINDFNELEVLKIAMKIEADGEKFYTSFLSKTKDERVKRTFKRLAEDEKSHYLTFKGLFEVELRKQGMDPSDVDTEEGLFDYMDSGIFIQGAEANSLKEVVMDGEIIELKSIAFYKKLLSETKNEGGKKALTEVLEQETMHYNILKSWEAAV